MTGLAKSKCPLEGDLSCLQFQTIVVISLPSPNPSARAGAGSGPHSLRGCADRMFLWALQAETASGEEEICALAGY